MLSAEDYAKFVKTLKERTEAMMKSESGAKFARLGLISERTLWLNPNSTSLVRAQPDMRRDMVRAHRQVELELFGSVADLPGEQQLLQASSVRSAAVVSPVSESPSSNPADTSIRFRPERHGSNEDQHFKAAYRKRPELMGVVASLFVTIFVLALDGGFNIVMGKILRGLGLLFLGAVAFALWAALHNWALTHPRE